METEYFPSPEPPHGVPDLLAPPPPAVLGDAPHLEEPQNAPVGKYDLLNSIPRECPGPAPEAPPPRPEAPPPHRCAVVTDLDLRLQYRGSTVAALTVSHPQGCRLYYGALEPRPDQVELFGPVGLQQVCFPGAELIQNQKQQQYTQTVLGALQRGLVLELSDHDLYAVRLCQCKVFWAGPPAPDQGRPNPLEREDRVKVFSLNRFLEGDPPEEAPPLRPAPF